MAARNQPLKGLLVLDFSSLLPGPLATLMLAEAGAKVIKIERPEGDLMRGFQPRWGANSANFALLNRGKKSMALDLKLPADSAKLEPLIDRADVIVEQFRPQVMKRLGLDYDTLSKRNPGIIYCSITGYGQTGPKRDVSGHDLNYIGDAGLLALSHGDAQHPVLPPALVADIAGGTYPAVMNILLALLQRNISGRGCHLDIAMTDNVLPFLYWALAGGFAADVWPGNGTDLVTGGSPRYRLYPTRDGKLLAAAPIEQKFWETFCDAIGLAPALRDDTADPATTIEEVARIVAQQDSGYWAQLFSNHDCACSIVKSVRAAVDDPQFSHRGVFEALVRNEQGSMMPALPLPIDRAFRQGMPQSGSAPLLGQHNDPLEKS